MSSTVDVTPNLHDTSLTLSADVSQQQPLTVREKIVNIFQDLEGARDEQRRVNTALEKEIQSRIEVGHVHWKSEVVLLMNFVLGWSRSGTSTSTGTTGRGQSRQCHSSCQSCHDPIDRSDQSIRSSTTVSRAIPRWSADRLPSSVCTNLENKLTAVKDKEIDLDDELRKAKECSIETDKRFQEVITSRCLAVHAWSEFYC